jgi:hypothetical protein
VTAQLRALPLMGFPPPKILTFYAVSLIRIYRHETEKDNGMTVILTIDSVMDSMGKFYIQLLDLIFRAAAISIKSLPKISLLDIKLKKRDGSYSSSSPDVHLLRLLRVSEMQIICGETPPRRDLHAPVLTDVEKLELGGDPSRDDENVLLTRVNEEVR